MRMRQSQNIVKSKNNPNEIWMRDKLLSTGLKWKRQAQWGYRIFDFWNHELGIAVEVDGLEHNKIYDVSRDEHNFNRSGILVIRVKNKNESDAVSAVSEIRLATSWNSRRHRLGLKPIKT